jgi:hypothetical protein
MKINCMINSQGSDLRVCVKINSCGARAVPLTCKCGVFHDR